jgi:guanylate kinase
VFEILIFLLSQHGQHYYFTTKEQFCQEIAEGKFLEYAEVHGRIYGTSKQAVRNVLESGRVCMLDIDVQGARLLRKSDIRAIYVFIAPPSLEVRVKA